MTGAGLLLVDKPTGMTSHDVIGRLRKVLQVRRIGHAGTLDPDATGMLLVGVGPATRLLQFLSGLDKEYRGTVRFGIRTDTLDASGQVLDRQPMPGLTRPAVQEGARSLTGEIAQVPPMVSAVKVGGEPLYARARRGEEVERAARRVTVRCLVVEEFAPGPYPEAVIRVVCSSGTYVRSLAADLGASLGGVAHLALLRRLAVGAFAVDDAIALAALEEMDDPWSAVRPPLEALHDLPCVEVDDERARAVAHGAVFTGLGVPVEGPVAVTHDGRLIAVYGPHARGAKPLVVLSP